jgi:hypothetical protein
MIAIAERLEQKLKQWEPEKSASVERLVAEIITLADQDCLDLLRSRSREQEVLDILDEPEIREEIA